VRHYVLDPGSGFRLDPEAVAALCDANTRIVLVISPHNPTGAVVEEAELRWLHDYCTERGVSFVCDQVYHPMYHGTARPSAAALPGAIVLGDCSKALCLSGLRVGWIVNRNAESRERQLDARGYFTISNNILGEALALHAIRYRARILARARRLVQPNLRVLDGFFERHSDRFGWVRPRGGFTAFPWVRDGGDASALCHALDAHGVGVVPGACMHAPAHFRIGFGASGDRFAEGVAAFERVLASWPSLRAPASARRG
jgi:aspartate/methionine/tyrosine aminotransferase